jgi:hypothetical protein
VQKDQNSPVTRRIDLSDCKLLLPYGRNAAVDLKVDAKVGGCVKIGLSKVGVIGKPGW